MARYALPKSQMAMLFSHTFEGPTVEWIHSLNPYVKKDWDLLVAKFVNQYSYISKVQVTLADLELL